MAIRGTPGSPTTVSLSEGLHCLQSWLCFILCIIAYREIAGLPLPVPISGVIYMARSMEIGKISKATRYAFACSSCLTILQEASGQALLNAGAVKCHALSLFLVVLQPRNMLAKQVRKA